MSNTDHQHDAREVEPIRPLVTRACLSSKSVTLQIRSTVPPGQSITQDVNTDAWLVYNGRGGTIHGKRD